MTASRTGTARTAATIPAVRKTAKPNAKPTAKSTTKPAATTPRAAVPSKKIVLRARFSRLKGTALKAHALAVYEELAHLYPNAHCELDYRNPYELTVATILSAQCTDKRVNMVTPALFTAYPTAAALADASIGAVEELVKSTGFFRAKAKSLVGMAQAVVAVHGGEIPATMEELVVLPGVGR